MGRLRTWVFVLLVLSGATYTQSAALTLSHQHTGPQAHNCAICQAGHLPLLGPSGAVSLSPPVPLEWRSTRPILPAVVEPLVIYGSPRAPPA